MNTTRPYGAALPNVFEPAPATSLASKDEIERARENTESWNDLFISARPQFSNLFVGRTDAQRSVAFRLPVMQGGAVRYAMSIAFPPEGLDSLLREEQATHPWYTAIIDRRGVIIARNIAPETYIGQAASPTLLAGMEGRPEGIVQGITVEGIPVVHAFSRSSRTGWSVAVAAPISWIQTPVRRSLWIWSVGILALVALGVAFARRTWLDVGGPLSTLSNNARAFERGDPIVLPHSRVREVRDCGRAWSLAIEADKARRAQERLRLEAEARQRELEQASREKDRVLAALGHELRNPLGAISNSVHVLEAAAPTDPRLAPMIGIIKRQTKHLGRLVEDMLDLARATFGKMRIERAPLDLLELARRTISGYEPLRGTIARIEVRGESVWVDGDVTRLDQVIRNLVDNAIKFTRSEGTIDIAARADNGEATLVVTDDGVGIPEALIERLFGAFVQNDQTIDRAQGGLGLGLALAREIVDLHGGRIYAESGGAGRGARITVRLPLKARPND